MSSIRKIGLKAKPAQYRKVLEKKAEEVRRSMSAQKAAERKSSNSKTIDLKLLREISDALRRIDGETYGICMECEEPISSKRLDAVPWARYCVSCQERIAARIEAGEEVDEYQEASR